MSDAINEFVITESGVTITVTVTVSDEGAKPSDRSRCEWYGEDMANKMFIKAAKKFSPRQVKLTKIHERFQSATHTAIENLMKTGMFGQ